MLFRVSVSIWWPKFPRIACSVAVGVSNILILDRSPDPDVETGRAAEGAEKMSACRRQRQRWRRRGRDVRILQEVSVSVSGSVYEERSPWPDSDEADAFCFMPVEESEREMKRMRNIAISMSGLLLSPPPPHWRYQRVS